MEKFGLQQSRLEAVCRGAICNRVGSIERAIIAPVDPKATTGDWELFGLEPMPAPNALEAVMEVISDLQKVFVLKTEG